MEIIDLRSDTVTQPTSAMRRAMAQAEVGDDVYGEDPTINRLQEIGAAMMGKEAGLFVPSGTMGNLAAILSHCGRGDEVILGNKAHTFLFEAGGISALGGVHSCQIPNQPDGTLAIDDIRQAIRPDDVHDPITRLIALENTHNRCGGVVLTSEYTRSVGELVRQYGLLFHLDGARIFNAAIALGVPASELAAPADSVTFCLSKGLCAPVGSVLCGSKDFIHRALHIRKQLGGGMRQAGILAAAGIVALESMVDRLADDHRRAKTLAKGLSGMAGLELDMGAPQTNMIFICLAENFPLSPVRLLDLLLEQGIRIGRVGENRFRLVTHYWIDDSAVERVIATFDGIMKTSRH
jgi:threonine aldolase